VDGFVDLLVELESLILARPTVSVAFARADLAGADLEFALGCSMMVAASQRRFSFAADPLISVGAYALLAQKIGFVLAERLMERGEIMDAQALYDLCLIKELAADDGEEAIDAFLAGAQRKHNACYGIYRAQRIATGSAHATLRAARLA
jgi:enoyl-CoA hydratase/carnithine racemase